MNKPFGLQNNCNHIFCFDCLSTWRQTGNKETNRRCPLCRIRSTFIAPSWRCFNNNNDKQLLINAHKLRLKNVPCQTLLRYGYCRFGHRCFYNHHIRFQSSFLFNHQQQQQNTIELSNENNNNNEQQESLRRIRYNSHRYRPY
ncbi:unnamed protein product [Adineta steineri]|uniref:RING-type E3 ubiquitin transferase n=1 Tax=Adineta steineri TaxID=433720 RepID=A0A813NG03_9BILA|nr:unnamed protein product [Adineta steineri]